MEIKRDVLLEALRIRENNGLVKVITGMRRSGKSYLLCRLFRDDLRARGVDDSRVIEIALDDIGSEHLREPHALYDHLRSRIGAGQHYIMLDEIQFVERFEEVLNGLLHLGSADIYVTGSNSRFLSTDIITEFRGRGDQVHVRPLSFAEFFAARGGEFADAWSEYLLYGGLPRILSMSTEAQKADYLTSLFKETYLRDIVERNSIKHTGDLDELVRILASAVGSPTNPAKLARAFRSVKGSSISDKTIKDYIDHMSDAFMIEASTRFDIKGKRYISTPQKYYFGDVGIRSAALGFRQIEDNHLMENVIFNELRGRGFSVDVGSVEARRTGPDGRRIKSSLEVDFIAYKGRDRYYIQSAYAMPDTEKRDAEKRPLRMIDDSFKKIVIDGTTPIRIQRDEHGITTLSIREFLTNTESLDA